MNKENKHVLEARAEGDIEITGAVYTPITPEEIKTYNEQSGMYWPKEKCFCEACVSFSKHPMAAYGRCFYSELATRLFYTDHATVIKVYSPIYRKKSYTTEVLCLQRLKGCPHAPKLIRYWIETNPKLAPPGSCCIEMELLQKHPQNRKLGINLHYLLAAIRQLYRRGILHTDLWARNVMWRGRCIVFIDYEMSVLMPLCTTKGPNSRVFQHLSLTDIRTSQVDVAVYLFKQLKRMYS